ncbi:MAG: CCA-adding enzyme [Chlamydiales bacterium]|nr:CCA-adding enzyme [Chlamydiales bacterium]MCH9635053.1 CCA-adding enzyme [Chlamydiales bacterium]
MTKKSLKIVQTLNDAGFIAYYAGGYVRDKLLGLEPHEVDIATNATVQQVQELFPKTIPVGISFGVVIVMDGSDPFEVATFRSDGDYEDGRHPTSISYCSPEEDAKRRDFTINGMFYDPLTDQVHDFVEGREDLKSGIIRAIGNPKLRFEEDRLRMVRAIRFAARFDFKIEKKTATAIKEQASTLFPAVSIERIWQEFGKMVHKGKAYLMLYEFGLLQTIFPALKNQSIEERVKPFDNFPKETPTILYLRELLVDTDGLVEKMKASRRDQKLLDYFDTKCTDLFDWTHFYRSEFLPLFLSIEEAKGVDISEHQERIAKLKEHIERREPVVSSTLLKERGIKPGPQMGKLLEQAERLAINEDLTAQEVLVRLGV